MHFVSCSACGRESHPIGLGEQRPGQFGLDERHQCRDRKAVGKPIAAGTAHAQCFQLTERLPEQPRRDVGLLHAQP